MALMSKRSTANSTEVPEAAVSDSRQMILETAARLFRHEGYAATTLRAIAAECDMKAGSIYYHFASKEAIVAEVLDIGVQRVFDAVKRAVDALPPETGLADTLRCAIEAHLRALLLAHDFTSANIRVLGQVPLPVREAHRALRRRYERYWVTLLEGLRQRGDIRVGNDLNRTVFFLFGAMNWATEWYDERKSPLTVVASELADLVANGLHSHDNATGQPKPSGFT